MKTLQYLTSRTKDQSGATAVVVAACIIVLLGIAALAADIGYVMVTRNELQNVADAASLAATRQLGAIYQTMSYEEQQNYVCDPTTILPVAQEVGTNNRAGGQNITINNEDIIIGDWDSTNLTFTPTLNQPDAVRVIGRRDGSANGPIATFFAGILGINTADVTAWATAALSGQSTATPGEVELPIGISRFWFDNPEYCNDEIKFSPTNDPDSCAGWTSFELSPPNDITIRRILQEEEDYESPGTIAGDSEYEFIGGDLSTPTFDALLILFMIKGYDVDANGDPVEVDADGDPVPGHLGDGYPGTLPLTDAEGSRLFYPTAPPTPRNEHVWETTVVVYDWDDCSNPNTKIKIVGFARVKVTDVLGPPDKLVKGQVICEYVSSEDNRGGGGEFGSKGSIPGLVEPFS
jgi:hypothetical protein